MADQEAAPSLSSQDDSDASLPPSTSSSAADTTSRIHYGVGDAGGAGAAPFAGSNTAPQSPYEVLLTQVTALQTDLSKTFAVCQQLRAENDTLSENYYRLKDEQGSLREKYSDTRRRFYDEQKLRMDIEQKHDDVVRSWKVQLDSKAQEFMELQAQMAPPRDLELLRMKIQEEFEVPHQEKVARLEAEVAKYREMFYNVRREHELLRTEYEQFSLDAGKREESLHASHLVVVNQLRAKLAAQAENHDDSHAIDEIRRLERTSGEQVVKIEALEHEVDDLRRAKEAAVVARDTAHLETARENTELLASVKTLEARAQNAEAHAASLSVQVERTQRRISEQQKRVGELDHELSLARREVERKEIERQDDDAAYAACEWFFSVSLFSHAPRPPPLSLKLNKAFESNMHVLGDLTKKNNFDSFLHSSSKNTGRCQYKA